jgi:hypothetical protein
MHTSQAADIDLPLANAKRLIVLVPDLALDELRLGRSIWNIARPAKLDILYLSVVRHWGDELRAFHKVTQLLAITNDPMIRVETLVRAETSWIKALREIRQPGDLIICDESQMAPGRIFRKKPLSSALSEGLQMPVLPISYIHPNGKNGRRSRLTAA